jgi:two-component system response regulator (stage 0 sporulation protein F)
MADVAEHVYVLYSAERELAAPKGGDYITALFYALEATMHPHEQSTPAIVVVDDEPDIVTILRRLVREMATDYEVIAASSGTEVLAHLDARPITLVIADYNMPGMNGLQLTTAIKARSERTCVMLITAYATPAVEERALAAHVDHYLPKPFPFDQFEHLLHVSLTPSHQL